MIVALPVLFSYLFYTPGDKLIHFLANYFLLYADGDAAEMIETLH